MGCYTALIALLFILHTVNGQTTTATTPSSTTDPPLSSAAPQSSGTPVQQTRSNDPLSSSTATSSSTTSPSDTTASSVGITPSSTDVTASLVGASSQVSNTDNPTSIATTKASSSTHQRPNATALPSNVTTPSTNTSSQSAWTTLATTGGSLNTTQYHFGNLSTPFPGINGTSPVPLVASFSRRCSSNPPLCCLGLNNSCFRGCFCDVACIRLKDCCPDFQTTCVTGVQIGSATVSSVSNATNATNATNTTNATNSTSTSFPVFSFPGNCSAQPALCCKGTNVNCFRGCFCDEVCQTLNDCCPDYADTCTKDIQKVIGSGTISILAPPNSTDASLEVSIQNAALQLQTYLKTTYTEISSFRIIKLKKTGKT